MKNNKTNSAMLEDGQLDILSCQNTIAVLSIGIDTGFLPDGTAFDLVEFIKRVPFKETCHFAQAISEFMIKHNADEYNIIMSYIYANKLHLPSAFKPLDIENVYRNLTVIYGKEITNEDNDAIIEYLVENNIPLLEKTFYLVRYKYLLMHLNNPDVNTERICSEEKQTLTLI